MYIMHDLMEVERKLSKLHRYSEQEIREIIPKLEKINELRLEKGAKILAHYYQIPPIQLIADKTGDSLELARYARDKCGGELVVSSTVYFMAEMTKILSPSSKVVIPDTMASCSIAEGMNAETVKRIRKEYPSSSIVAYINTSAAAKAEVDAVCTSANAGTIMERIDGDPVIMLPDYLFAKNIFNQSKEKLPVRRYLAYKKIHGSEIVLEDLSTGDESRITTHAELPMLDEGTCIVHKKFTPFDIYQYRKEGVVDTVLAHPEVRPEVAELADVVGGTGRMIKYLKERPEAKRVLFITECDMAAPLREEFPDREFFTSCRLCDYMRRNNLDNLTRALDKEIEEVTVETSIAIRALRSMERMFELSVAGKA